jgi:phage-related protein
MTTRLSSNSVGASKLDRRIAVAPMMDWPEAIYVLSAFEKKTRKTPRRELEPAADRFRSVTEERRRQRR